jgi:hypothetical protein
MVVNLSVDAENNAFVFINDRLGTTVYNGKEDEKNMDKYHRHFSCSLLYVVFSPNLPTPTIARRS